LFRFQQQKKNPTHQMLATTTMQPSYFVPHNHDMLLHRPHHFGQGIFLGSKHLCIGVGSGIRDLVVEPFRGVVENQGIDRLTGFGMGLGRGMLGVTLKPLVGVFDFMSCTWDGLAAMVCPAKEHRNLLIHLQGERVRQPRSIEFDRVLRGKLAAILNS
jgi:hypothetical protein